MRFALLGNHPDGVAMACALVDSGRHRLAAYTSPVGTFRLLEVERVATGEVLNGVRAEGQKPAFPGWDVLRTLGGEVQEVSAFADRDELRPGDPVLVAGRFEQGGVFQ